MPPDPDRLFFIVGTGRCGTTLLQAMLSSHPNLYIPPELRYFGRHEPAVRFHEPLRDGDVEPYLTTCSVDIWWQDMGLDREAFEAAVRGGTRSSRNIYLWLLSHISAKRGNDKPRLGEKTPYYVLFADHIADMFPGARFVHLHRDPRDVVASYLEQYWSSGATVLRIASFLKHALRRADHFASVLGPSRFCDVKYEDLVAHPERELRRLCGFLGEDYDPAMLRYNERRDSGYLAVEEGWKGLTKQALTPSRIGRYAERMTPRQVWIVERMLGPLLPRYGYRPGPGSAAALGWAVGFWGERIYRKALRTIGLRRPLLDEHAVLAKRNELLRRRAPAG